MAEKKTAEPGGTSRRPSAVSEDDLTTLDKPLGELSGSPLSPNCTSETEKSILFGVIGTTYNQSADCLTFKASPETIEALKTKVEVHPLLCIPTIKRIVMKHNQEKKYIPDIVTSGTLKLRDYQGAAAFCVKADELDYYQEVLDKELPRKKVNLFWCLVVRPVEWNERGVRFAREVPLCLGKFLGCSTVHIDDDRAKVRHLTTKKTYGIQEAVNCLYDILKGKNKVKEEEEKEGRPGAACTCVGLGSAEAVKGFVKLHDITNSCRVNQFFLIDKCGYDKATFVSANVRKLTAAQYSKFKSHLEAMEDEGALCALIGVEDYELCYRLVQENGLRTSCYHNKILSAMCRNLDSTIEKHIKKNHVKALASMYNGLQGFLKDAAQEEKGKSSQSHVLDTDTDP